MESAEVEVECVKDKLKAVDSKISMTFDSWTSTNGDPFLSLSVHYVSAHTDNPQQWELRSDQLTFTLIVGNHIGDNIAKILIETIERYGIRDKVGWFTADNATNNDTAIAAVARYIDPSGEDWDPVQHRVRCMEHALHLAAKHFVEDVSTTSASALLKKVKGAMVNTTGEDNDLEA